MTNLLLLLILLCLAPILIPIGIAAIPFVIVGGFIYYFISPLIVKAFNIAFPASAHAAGKLVSKMFKHGRKAS